jgi:hypothetical protein
MIIRVSGTVGQWGGASGPGNLGWAARFRSSLFLVIFFNNYDHYYEEDGDDMYFGKIHVLDYCLYMTQSIVHILEKSKRIFLSRKS